MGWFRRSPVSSQVVNATPQDGWFKRNLKKITSRFRGKTAESLSGRVQPRLEHESCRKSVPSDHAASLSSRAMSSPRKKSRRWFSSRDKLEKLASSKRLNQQKVYQALAVDARRGGAGWLKMLNSNVDDLARLFSVLSIGQQEDCMMYFTDSGAGARTPHEARLMVCLVEKMAADKAGANSTCINEFLLKLTGGSFRPHILVAMLDEGGKRNLVSYETLLHICRHHFLQEGMALSDYIEAGKPLPLGVPPDVSRQLASGQRYLSDPNSAEMSELVGYSVIGRLLHAAQEGKASSGVQKMLLMLDHLAFRDLVAYNQKYGQGKNLIGTDGKDFRAALEHVTPARLEAIATTRGRDVPALLRSYGWNELPADYPRTTENAPGDFLGFYMRTHVGRPPKPLRTHERETLEDRLTSRRTRRD